MRTTIAAPVLFFLLFVLVIDGFGQNREQRREIRRLLRTIKSDLELLKTNGDPHEYEWFIGYGDIPAGKIGLIYSKVDYQMNELQKKVPSIDKPYKATTKKIIKALKKETQSRASTPPVAPGGQGQQQNQQQRQNQSRPNQEQRQN
jgi:hypothetical protein